MANKPGEANFFPDVPQFPSMGTFQPVYGKFDLTTYIQGASDYEIMAFLVGKYNACLEAYGNITKLSTDTITACKQLQDWINSWFDNLDVQEELNKKIDSMVQDGSFGRLLHQTFDTQINQQTANATTAWLVANVTPTGSAVVVDKSLSIEGAAADAKVTGWCLPKLVTWSNTNLDTVITVNNDSITFDTNWTKETKITNANGMGILVVKPEPITLTLTEGFYAVFVYFDGDNYNYKYKVGVAKTSSNYGMQTDTYTLRIIYVDSATSYTTQWSYLYSQNLHYGNAISFGDSTTYGVIGNASGQSPYNYPSAIAKALKMTVTNKAIGGQGLIKDWTTIIDTINATDFSDCKLCTIAWAYNDYVLYPSYNLGTVDDTSNETVLGAYRAILDIVQAKNINTRVVLITGYGYPDIQHGELMMEQPMPFKDGTITAREYYNKLEEMCVKHGYTCINQAKQPWLNMTNISLIGDNIHPTNNGYKVYSDYIVGRISSIFNPVN